MTTFALIHGAGDGGWYWHLVEAELRARGHDTVAPDLPTDDDDAGLEEYAESVVQAVGGRGDVIVVGHSYGAFTAPLVAEKLSADVLVLVAGMIPAPWEAPGDWWRNTGCEKAVSAQAERDGGLTGSEDPFICFFHDVPRALAEEAMSRERDVSDGPNDEPWPLDAWPNVPTKFILCTEDRLFPSDFLRRLSADRLGITEPDEIAAGHCVALSQPAKLAEILASYAAEH